MKKLIILTIFLTSGICSAQTDSTFYYLPDTTFKAYSTDEWYHGYEQSCPTFDQRITVTINGVVIDTKIIYTRVQYLKNACKSFNNNLPVFYEFFEDGMCFYWRMADGKWVWFGEAISYKKGYTPNHINRCKGLTSSGTRCKNKGKPDYCYLHD